MANNQTVTSEEKSTSAIRRVMRREVENCRDRITGEVNHTQLAETAANELNIYENTRDYTIPEYVFDLATEFA